MDTKNVVASLLSHNNRFFAKEKEIIINYNRGALCSVQDSKYIKSEIELYEKLITHMLKDNTHIHILTYDNIDNIPTELLNEYTIIVSQNDFSRMSVVDSDYISEKVYKTLNSKNVTEEVRVIELDHLNLNLKSYIERCIDTYNFILDYKLNMNIQLSELINDAEIRNKFAGSNLYNFYVTDDSKTNSIIKLDNNIANVLDSESNRLTINRDACDLEIGEDVMINHSLNTKILSITDMINVADEVEFVEYPKTIPLVKADGEINDLIWFSHAFYFATIKKGKIEVSYSNSKLNKFTKLYELSDISVSRILNLKFSIMNDNLILVVSYTNKNNYTKAIYVEMDDEYEFSSIKQFEKLDIYDDHNYTGIVWDDDTLLYLKDGVLNVNGEPKHLKNVSKYFKYQISNGILLVSYEDTNGFGLIMKGDNIAFSSNKYKLHDVELVGSNIIGLSENKLISILNDGDSFVMESNVTSFSVMNDKLYFITSVGSTLTLVSNNISNEDIFSYTKISDKTLSLLDNVNLISNKNISDSQYNALITKTDNRYDISGSLYFKKFDILSEIELDKEIGDALVISRGNCVYNNGLFTPNLTDNGKLVLESSDIDNINVLSFICSIKDVTVSDITIDIDGTIYDNTVVLEDDRLTCVALLNVNNINKLNIYISFEKLNKDAGIVNIFGAIE